MICVKALLLFCAELVGVLSLLELAELQAHLDACPDCRETYAQLHEQDAALQESELAPPTALHDGVICADGTPEKVITPELLETLYSIKTRLAEAEEGRLIVPLLKEDD